MVDSEYSTDNYKFLKLSIEQKVKNPQMLRSVPDHLKTKKMCKNAIKKLPFIIKICS